MVFITVATAGRKPLFAGADHARIAARAAVSLHDGERRVYGYCVMPDHVHLLLSTGGETLGGCVRLFKGRASRNLRLAGLDGPVFQRGYHDRVVRRDEGIVRTLEYMVMNPVRAGLAAEWWNHPWSGSPYFDGFGPGFFTDPPAEASLW